MRKMTEKEFKKFYRRINNNKYSSSANAYKFYLFDVYENHSHSFPKLLDKIHQEEQSVMLQEALDL